MSPTAPIRTLGRRSLQGKIVRTLLLVVLGYAALDHLAQRMILLPSFETLQHDQAMVDLRRATERLDASVDDLELRARGLARLEGTAAFLRAESDELRELVLDDGFLAHQELDVAMFVGLDGTVRWSDLSPEVTDERGQLADFPRGRLSANHPLTRRSRELPVPASGLYPSAAGPMLVSVEPAADAGWVIFAERLSSRRLTDLSGGSLMGADAWTLGKQPIEDDLRETLDRATSSVEPILEVAPDGTLHAYTALEDLSRRPTIVLRTSTRGTLLDSGEATMRYALLSALAVGLTMLLVLQRLLGRAVIRPLRKLTRGVVEIGARDDDTMRLDLQRDDEIGVLASEFDAMMDKLKESRMALVETARSAGMSEIATGILHNIGNVLNSVVLSRELAHERLQKSSLPRLEQLVTLLESQDDLGRFLTEDPKGAKVLPFLSGLHKSLVQERGGALEELESQAKNLEHIRELVASQQALAGRSTVEEMTSIQEQVQQAIEVTGSALGAKGLVRFELDIDDLPSQRLDRHKLLEILVNLVQNARQAVGNGVSNEPTVWVVGRIESDRIKLTVRDNGRGIDAENLERIFAHGFTTRRDGHGFGLHASANSARELGGDLSVHSDGPGHGAEFTLDLPLHSTSSEAAA